MITDLIKKCYFKIFPPFLMSPLPYRIDRFVRQIAQRCDQKESKLIDVGAGSCQYKKYFKNLIYKTQDIINNKDHSIDYLSDINNIPVKDSSFDYILCTQVLEHVKTPPLVFQEFNRILKPGGKVFLTTHGCYEEHMVPYDYFRFTRYGLRYLAESSGFKVEKIKSQGGRFIVISDAIQNLIPPIYDKIYLSHILLYLIFTIPILLFNSTCIILDKFDKKKLWTINYECIFQKKK